MSTMEIPEDIFGRAHIAERMCELIVEAEADAISPLALDGAWGCGKSVHARRMQDCFNNEYADRIKCIYWNASESDHSDYPMLAFVSFLYKFVPEEQKKAFGNRGFSICCCGLLGGVASIANQVIAAQVGVNIKEVHQDVQNRIGANDESASARFSEFLEITEKESARMDAARELLDIVREEKDLIIIVDELDRCRPDFALSVLEKIKHLFTSANCKFILVMNKASMAKSVEKLYGLPEESSVQYLGKYIKLTFQLPVKHPASCGEVSDCAVLYFCESVKDAVWKNTFVQGFIQELIEYKGISLREIEKIVAAIDVVQKLGGTSLTVNTCYHSLVAVYVAYLVALNPVLAMRMAYKCASREEAMEDLGWGFNLEPRPIRKKPQCITYLEPIIHTYFVKDIEEHKYSREMPYNEFELYPLVRYFEMMISCSTFM